MNIEIGKKYIYKCRLGAAFFVSKEQCPSLHAYASHSGQPVLVERAIATHVPCDPVFYITADDGWHGAVFAGELEAIR
jgi:hypothetical protein